MFKLILESYANEIIGNILSTMPGNKMHGFIIMPKKLNIFTSKWLFLMTCKFADADQCFKAF